jgi:hypothetical protein
MQTPIDKMVDRFLSWRLPEDFGPDCYVSFDREKAKQGSWPIGTNLLTADQAHQMFEYVTGTGRGEVTVTLKADTTEVLDVVKNTLTTVDMAVKLRSALVGLVGVDGKAELEQMEVTMRLLPAPDEDKAVSINAIHALLATLPE